jgi:integrase
MRVSEAIQGYLRKKRANGLAYETEEETLSAFQRSVNDVPIGEVTSQQVSDFLNCRNVSNATWMAKHYRLRMLFEFWTDRGSMCAISMPEPQRRGKDRRPTPFIYTRTEIRRLIEATQEAQSNRFCMVTGATLRTVLLTLYGTGAILGEMLCLKRDDLDLKGSLISLCGDRKVTPRRVPISRDVRELLGSYLRSQDRRSVLCPNVFVSKLGGPIAKDSIQSSFSRVRIRAGVIRIDGEKCLPRMCDLRRTFAVHRIASWIEESTDLNRMLPALSAYMGLGGVASTQHFLFMTPERFKLGLDKLSPHKTRKHWRDDPGLMTFLATL